jgi:hypothetical protein
MKAFTTINIFTACLVISVYATAQLKSSPYEVGIQIGTGLYAGDLAPTLLSPYKSPGIFLGVSGSKKLSDVLALEAGISFGKVKANDAYYSNPEYRQQRNFNFNTLITELSAGLIWNPLGRERMINPYFVAAAGLSFLKVRRDYSNLNAEYFSNDLAITQGLPQDIAHKLPRIIPVLPVGGGLRFSIGKKISINLQTTYRLMSTDYLDGFSKGANPNRKDHYYTHTTGFIYAFGGKNTLACPR